jgi:hypothetical protein
MNRLSADPDFPHAESLFAIERELVPEPDEVRERVLRRARVAVPRSLPVRHSLASRRGSPWGTSAKVALAAVVISGLCSAAFYAGYRSRDTSPSGPTTDSAVVAQGAAPASPNALATPAVVGPEATGVHASSPGSTLAESESTNPPTAQPQPAKSATESEIYAMELRVLQPAQWALARKDYAFVLASVAEHQRRFPAGRLAEEREALRVKALLGLGRDAEAKHAGTAFQKRFPDSALGPRVEEMLEPDK